MGEKRRGPAVSSQRAGWGTGPPVTTDSGTGTVGETATKVGVGRLLDELKKGQARHKTKKTGIHVKATGNAGSMGATQCAYRKKEKKTKDPEKNVSQKPREPVGNQI